MFKYIIVALTILQLSINAQEVEVMPQDLDLKCEIAFNECTSKCEENSDTYDKCYDKCEVLDIKCLDIEANTNK